MKISPYDVKYRIIDKDAKVYAKDFDSRNEAQSSSHFAVPGRTIQGYAKTPASAIDARIRADRAKVVV